MIHAENERCLAISLRGVAYALTFYAPFPESDHQRSDNPGGSQKSDAAGAFERRRAGNRAASDCHVEEENGH